MLDIGYGYNGEVSQMKLIHILNEGPEDSYFHRVLDKSTLEALPGLLSGRFSEAFNHIKNGDALYRGVSSNFMHRFNCTIVDPKQHTRISKWAGKSDGGEFSLTLHKIFPELRDMQPRKHSIISSTSVGAARSFAGSTQNASYREHVVYVLPPNGAQLSMCAEDFNLVPFEPFYRELGDPKMSSASGLFMRIVGMVKAITSRDIEITSSGDLDEAIQIIDDYMSGPYQKHDHHNLTQTWQFLNTRKVTFRAAFNRATQTMLERHLYPSVNLNQALSKRNWEVWTTEPCLVVDVETMKHILSDEANETI